MQAGEKELRIAGRLNHLIKLDLSGKKKKLAHMQTAIILSDTLSDKWLNSLELVLPFGDLWPYYWRGLKWLINYLTHASKKLGHCRELYLPVFPHVCEILAEYSCVPFGYVTAAFCGSWWWMRSYIVAKLLKRETLSSQSWLPGSRWDMKGVHV